MQEVKEPNNGNNNKTKKPLIYYYVIAMIILLVLNAVLFPSLNRGGVTEVGYNQFLDMIDAGAVKQVAYDETSSQYAFIAEIEGKPGVFVTGVWPNDGERLLEQLRSNPDITFSASIPTQANPIMEFLTNWVLPIIFFVLIGNLLSRYMMKRMGASGMGGLGNAM